MTEYLSLAQILDLHGALVRAFGGDAGLRDRGLLESAVARPAATFGGEDLFDDVAAKAAALMHALVLNHPFLDANKRVGVAAADLFLSCNGHLLSATDKELEQLTLDVSQGTVAVEALAIWFRQRIYAE